MLQLPRRESEVTIEIQDGVRIIAAPLTDAQYLALQEDAELSEDTLRYRISRQPRLFEDRLLRVEGVQVEGQPFDAQDPEHVARLPQPWRALTLARLIRYAQGLKLTEDELGNSMQPAATSPAEKSPAES